MINSKDLFRDLRKQITLSQEAAETDSMLYLILENVNGVTRTEILAQKAISLTSNEAQRLAEIIERVNENEPIQYILGQAHFYGRDFLVNSSVLIPRPETELLIEEVLKRTSNIAGKILDIGTGSGCIAVTLAKELSQKKVIAVDVSKDALQTAGDNAKQLGANIDFHQLDILSEEIPFQDLEFILSNPPYIAFSEKTAMNDNVLKHEPHLALFVPDNNPLIFYKIIAKKGLPALKSGGRILVEINERFGKEVRDIFTQEGFENVRLIKDLQNKDRIVHAMKRL